MKSEWALTFGALERNKQNQKLIQVSMKRWQAHNEYGRSVGRGLSNSELVDKVVDETGASRTHVLDSLTEQD
jgi:hypothetical protein